MTFVSVALGILLCDRIRLLVDFGFRYTDEDQTLLWYAASEAWHGRFHEPCFYGQAYNSTLESILSLPLYAIGVPLPYAVPIITCLLGLLPYLVLAGFAWWRGMRKTAVVLVLLPLTLPIPYAMVTAIPRGFVTGLAVGTFAVLCFVCGRSSRNWFGAGVLSVLSLTLNPNVAVLLLAAGIYALLGNVRRGGFYLATLAGMAVGALAALGVVLFYRAHPNYDLHEHKALAFTWELWFNGMRSLDGFFGSYVPVAGRGWIALAALGLFPLALVLLRQYRAACSIFAAGVLCLFALGVNRIHEGGGSVFLSSSRMFLAVPVVWAMGLVWIADGMKRHRVPAYVQWTSLVLLATVTAALVVARHWSYGGEIASILRDRKLDVWTVPEIERSAAKIDQIAREQNAHVILFPTNRGKALNYALPALTDSRVETLFPPYERRTWRLEQESHEVHPKVLVYIDDAPRLYLFATDSFKHVRMVSESPRIMCIEHSGKSLLEIADTFGVKIRHF